MAQGPNASTRVFTREELDTFGIPHECYGADGTAEELARIHTGNGRWDAHYLLVCRTPDDGRVWGVEYSEGLTEYQENETLGEYGPITAVEMEPREVTVTRWVLKGAPADAKVS